MDNDLLKTLLEDTIDLLNTADAADGEITQELKDKLAKAEASEHAVLFAKACEIWDELDKKDSG